MNMNTKQYLFTTLTECRFELLKTFRTAGFVIPSLLFPVMFYVLFGIIVNPSQDSVVPSYLLVSYCVFGCMGPALFAFGADVAIERQRHLLVMKQISPLPMSSYFIAKLAVSSLFAIIILVLLFTVAALFGDVKMAKLDWLLTFATVLLGVPLFSAMGMYLGLILKGNVAMAVINVIYLPLAFLSGLMLPLEYFPSVLQTIGAHLPPYHLAQLGLKIQHLDDQGSIAWHLFNIISLTALFGVLAMNAYKRTFKA